MSKDSLTETPRPEPTKTKISTNSRRILNKRGVTLVEGFFSFLILITISVMILNSFAKRDSVSGEVREIELDHFETMKAVSKGLLFHGKEDNYEFHLTGYIPVVDTEHENEIHLVDVYQQGTTGMQLKDFGRKYEMFSRYKVGETHIETQREKLRNDYRVVISVKTYKEGKFNSTRVPDLKVLARGDVETAGVHYTIPRKFFKGRYTDYKFDNIVSPVNIQMSGVEHFEETYGN